MKTAAEHLARRSGALTQAPAALVLLVSGSQLSHQVGAVVAGVVGDDRRQLDAKNKTKKRDIKTQELFSFESKKSVGNPGRTIMSALANDSMATASLPGVLLARSLTTLAISISEQPDGEEDTQGQRS